MIAIFYCDVNLFKNFVIVFLCYPALKIQLTLKKLRNNVFCLIKLLKLLLFRSVKGDLHIMFDIL